MREERRKSMMLIREEEENSKINPHLRQTFGTLRSCLGAVNKDLVNAEFDEMCIGLTGFL